MERRSARLVAPAAVGLLALGSAVGLPAASAGTDTREGVSANAVLSVSTQAQLRRAVATANSTPGVDVIVLGASITLTGMGSDADGPERGDLDVTDSLVIQGQARTISGGGQDRIFDVKGAGTTLEINRTILTGGAPAAGESGGAVRSTNSTLRVKNSLMAGNVAEGMGASGGAIFNDQGTLQVLDSVLAANTATRAGGAIEANAGRTLVLRSAMVGNATGAMPGNGGGLHLTGAGEVRVSQSTVRGNRASAEGGGLWNSAGGTFVVDGSTISGNKASGPMAENGGGGLYNDGGTMVVFATGIGGNLADGTSGSGGGLLNNGGKVTVVNSVFRGNGAKRAGGGIETAGGQMSLQRVNLQGNSTGSMPGNGGGLHLGGDGLVRYSTGIVTGNRAASEGGGLWNSTSGTLVTAGVTARNNRAPEGPNVYNDEPGGGTFTFNGMNVAPGNNTIAN